MDSSESLELYDILDIIGASEKMRDLYKEKAQEFQILYDVGFCKGTKTAHIMGSMSDGTTTPGLKSDLDLNICLREIPVLVKPEDADRRMRYWAILFRDFETTPGYVKLRFGHNSAITPHLPYSQLVKCLKNDRRGNPCWSKLDMFQRDINLRQEVHGPAITVTHHIEPPTDYVFCLKCNQWPPLAMEWITRERRFGWPDKDFIDRCQKLGFFVVKAGYPYSEEKDIEWRISFSFQERLLMNNLTEVQEKCYVLLKLINHDLIQRQFGEYITSYHCKTAILYAIEQNPQSIWYSKNIFECVKKCITFLLDWTRNGHCPNYFIPGENMFVRKMNGEIRIQVIRVLEDILDKGEPFLKKIETDNVGKYLMHRNDRNELDVLKNISRQEYLRCMYNINVDNVETVLNNVTHLLYSNVSQLGTNQQNVNVESHDEVGCAIEGHRKLIDWLRNLDQNTEYTIDETRDIINPIFPFLHTSLACHLLSFALRYDDMSLRQKNIDLADEEFQKGIASDVASGRLKYYTYLYKVGKYELCEQELNLLEKHFDSSVISISPFTTEKNIINNDLKTKLQNNRITTEQFLQRYVCACVIFLPTELELIPVALQFEMFRSTGTSPLTRTEHIDYWYDWVVVESKVYMYFLWYLLARATDASRDKRFRLISKLESSANECRFHADTAFNLLAWTYSLEHRIPTAIQYLVRSWNNLRCKNYTYYKPYFKRYWAMRHNAAKWHMLLLLKKVWFSNDENEIHSFCFKCFQYNICGLKRCSRCKIAKYCTRICQEMDWQTHRTICKIMK